MHRDQTCICSLKDMVVEKRLKTEGKDISALTNIAYSQIKKLPTMLHVDMC